MEQQMAVEWHERRPMRTIGNHRVDIVLATLLSRAVGEERIGDVVEAMSSGVFWNQVQAILRLANATFPLGIRSIPQVRKEREGVLTGEIHLDDRTMWRGGMIEWRGDTTSLPLTMRQGLEGSLVNQVFGHPLLPALPITYIDVQDRLIRADVSPDEEESC